MSDLFIPDIGDADNLTAALSYAEAGWYILPVKRGTKDPGTIVGKHWHHQSSRDPHVITAWFAGTSHGIALHCGRSGAIVIDLDKPQLFPDPLRRHLDTAPYQSTRLDTPDRGHYIFTTPPGRIIGNSNGKLGRDWGEIRGLNGVIIAAPTFHPEGGRYQWQRGGTVPQLPDEIAEQLPEAEPAEDAASDERVMTFIAEHTRSQRPEILAGWRNALEAKIEDGHSRHNSTLSIVTGALKESRCDYFPAETALKELRVIFTNAVTLGPNQRTPHEAASEWRGIVAWAVGQASAAKPDDIRARTEQKMPEDPKPPQPPPPGPPIPVDEALTVFNQWLHIDDPAPVLAVAATTIANLAEGDPVWLLLVGPPSGGKTEILSSLAGLDYIVSAATVTEAALLSGTPRKERAKTSSGGLLRQIGEFGVLLAKDFTSVLSQNRDTARAAMAALREVYDGRWDRPVGADGGRVLHWHGKCGFIGGVVPAYDSYSVIVNTLGDRFILLRMPDINAADQSVVALAGIEHEKQMRIELAAAMTGLIAAADPTLVHRTLTSEEIITLSDFAIFAARARTSVIRDGYTQDLLVPPQAEGPARIVKALRRMYGGLEAIGVAEDDRWQIIARIAIDCAPAIRVPLMRVLLSNNQPERTSDIARRTGMVTKTCHRYLEDLALLGIADRAKLNDADNSPDMWSASQWLRDNNPVVRHICLLLTTGTTKEEGGNPRNGATISPYQTSVSHSEAGQKYT